MSGRRIGNYQILDYVGSGGFGSVFKAEDVTSANRVVAIKELHRKHTRDAVIKQRFFQEAVAMARLDHPNLPRLYTFGEDNGSYYLVMEFLSGRLLGDEISGRGPLPQAQALPVIEQVLEAVSYAHRNGIIHRDLKPDNIMLLEDTGGVRVKVLDFGIARMMGGGNLTLTGEGFGTPAYMSPERISASEQIDHRIDIYSAGIILYEMLTGRVPFQSTATDPSVYWAQMRRLHETAPLPPLESFGVNAELESVVARAAAKRPDDRYATADDMLAEVRRLSGAADRPALQRASLLLTTLPAAAQVYVDDIQRGTSDAESGRLSVEDLAPGLHTVRVARQGYNDYRISVSFEAGRETRLQAALAARATMHAHPAADTLPIHSRTEPGECGIYLGTTVRVESLPPRSQIYLGDQTISQADEDGRATLALAPGSHEIEVRTPSGAALKQTITVTEQDAGAVKTLILPVTARAISSVSAEPPANTPSAKKWLAWAVSAALLVGLLAASYVAFRGPARVNSASPPAEQSGPDQKPSVDDGQAAREAAAKALQTEQATIAAANKAVESEPKKMPKEAAAPVRETPQPPQKPVPAEACVTVSVSGPAGEPVGRLRMALIVEPGSGSERLYGGPTDPGGIWRQCGLTSGQRVQVTALGPRRALLATRQITLTPGTNAITIQLPRNPTLGPPGLRPSNPSRRPNDFRRP